MENMHCVFVYRLALILGALAKVTQGGDYKLDFDITKTTANIGETVDLTCRVENKNRKRFFAEFKKRIGDENINIAKNNVLEGNFRTHSNDRYTLKAVFPNGDTDNSVVIFTLNITNVQIGDSGMYGCYVPDAAIEITKNLTVWGPMESIEFTSQAQNSTKIIKHPDKEEIEFEENERHTFKCRVKGGYPKPVIKIIRRDEEKDEDEDITKTFDSSIELKKEGNFPGLQQLSYDGTLKNQDMPVTFLFSKKTLRCEANIPGSPFKTMQTGVHIKLHGYQPNFLCEQVVITELHQTNVNITCRVVADPPAHDWQFMWKRKNAGATPVNMTGGLNMTHSAQNGPYTPEVVAGDNDFEQLMILRIGRVHDQHFRKYYFEATNALGTKSHEIELQRDPASEFMSGGAMVSVCSCLWTVMTAALLLV